MRPENRRIRRHLHVPRALAAALLLVLALTATLAGGRPSEKGDNKSGTVPRTPAEKAAAKTDPSKRAAAVVEAHCTDGSILNLTVLDERIELITPYGKLLIPVREIERIEIAFRIPEEVARRVEAAIADLGKADFSRREAASAALLELRERAYPSLLKAAKARDAEVVLRARELLEKIRKDVPEERLQIRPHDVVYTADSKNTGRIASPTLKVLTAQFGEQQLKLSDVLEVRLPSASDQAAANAKPDPGNLSAFTGQIGAVYTFHVNPRINAMGGGGMIAMGGGGMLAGNGIVWGSDVYTLDSSLALAAVHAGVLKPGQAGTVRVKILGPQAAYAGSTRHGVTSQPYGPWNGSFQFVKSRGRGPR